MESDPKSGVSHEKTFWAGRRHSFSTALKIIASKHQQIHRKFLPSNRPYTHGKRPSKLESWVTVSCLVLSH